MVLKFMQDKQKEVRSGDLSMTFINQGSEITGDVFVSGNLRVEGKIIGNIRVDGNLEVSESGMIEGKTVSARNILVLGRVKATITAHGQLSIHGKGEVEGDVFAESLDIEAGARFIGYSNTSSQHHADISLTEQSVLSEHQESKEAQNNPS